MTVLDDGVIFARRKLKRKNEELSPGTNKKLLTTNMLSEYKSNENHYRSTGENGQDCPVATLSNMGNTCFLNSVLYTLRFAPTFLHNLHHLIGDLVVVNSHLNANKAKSSSLGGNVGTVSGPSSRSTSSKALLSFENCDIVPKSPVQIVSEKLHELFITMRNLEIEDSTEAFQPFAFLQAVRDANYIFEGNHQQDAHELLVYLLNNLRETCGVLQQLVLQQAEDGGAAENSVDSAKKKIGYNFIAEDFEGVTLRRTKCLECEETTERKEPFYDIPVPIMCNEDEFGTNPNEIYRRACVTSEKLCDSNKYLCDNCKRYNEASREVLFEKLPNIMILQLKRFTTTSAGVQKVNSYLPTPLKLDCFCESCCQSQSQSGLSLHRYQLCCVIMHLGRTMASGHYIAYVKVTDHYDDYTNCTRDLRVPRALSSLCMDSINGIIASKNCYALGMCKSVDCCSIKLNINVIENVVNNYSKKNAQDRWMPPMMNEVREEIWLECDDENVRPISNNEFQDLLSYKPNSTSTPYLLFYSKINDPVIGE